MPAASREVKFIKDFGGGLNYDPDQTSLRENQTPDALNVDFKSGSGFQVRGGFEVLTKQTGLNGAGFLAPLYYGATDVMLIRDANGYLATWDGTTYGTTAHVLTDDTDERVRSDVFSFELSGTRYSKAYFSNGRASTVINMRTWDGTTFSTLGNSFNDDYLTPAGGNMPKAEHVLSYNNHMWVAGTVEAGVSHPHRVRFSHLGMPEDWATADYFDVDPGDDGNPIVGLVALKQMLLVFKRSSVWAVYGYDRDSYVLEQVTAASGSCSCGAQAVNSDVCYWFGTDGQLYAFNGRSVAVLSEPISWWSELGKIKHGGFHRVAWMDGRLWMRVQAGPLESVPYWTFIWDPATKSFTRYDKVISDLFHWEKIGADADPLFLFNGDQGLYRHDRDNITDEDADGNTVRIDAFYRTAWYDAGETATRKRWKRPRLTASADNTTTVEIEVFYDVDPDNVGRNMQMVVETPSANSLWGTAVWGDTWYAPADQYYRFDRLGASGTAYSIQYKFSSPDNPGRWSVNQIAVPFRRKQVR